MAKEVIMPKFGFTQEAAQIVRWLKQPGETVEQGDPIAEVTTDKVNMEVEAPASGVLDGVRFQEGDTVPVTEIIAYIRGVGEALPAAVGSLPAVREPSQAQPSSSPASSAGARATPVAAKLAESQGVDLNRVAGTGPGGRITRRDIEEHLKTAPHDGDKTAPVIEGPVRAVPAARRLARELGIELGALSGSGPRGRVQSADVRAEHLRRTTTAATSSAVAGPGVAGLKVLKAIPLAGMRRTIAARLQKSFQESPHVFFDAHIDVTEAERLRSRANARLDKTQSRISLTAIIVKACAWALGRHPLLNSRIEGDQILLVADIHIGVAVALEEGLIVPVVRDVPRKGLAQLAAEIADLAERARTNHLRPDDVMDGTFTVSNLGMFGIDRFTAIVNPPQAAILAVSRVSKRVVADETDQVAVRPMMTVTLSADHRVVDGAVAARFMADLRDSLEQPALLTL